MNLADQLPATTTSPHPNRIHVPRFLLVLDVLCGGDLLPPITLLPRQHESAGHFEHQDSNKEIAEPGQLTVNWRIMPRR
jgi:hypothetical protein